MNNQHLEDQPIQDLARTLFSTLNESVFFSELSRYFSEIVPVDKIYIFQMMEDGSVCMVAEDGHPVANGMRIPHGAGVASYVAKTKRPYFSNNVSRDPVFHQELSKGIAAEMCVPMTNEGMVMGTIHFQSYDDRFEFTRDDINKVLEALSLLKKPLANMKMYLTAKYLNESLLRKIELKEQELETRRQGVRPVISNYKIQDKEIIGHSESMKRIFGLIKKIADTDVNAMIVGEAGTGREMIARKIHCKSNRKEYPFLTVDCSALSDAQIEVELFGEEGQDVTGAARVRQGILEMANGGTIFINCISQLSLNLQSKLIYFLNENLAFRVGGQAPFRSDVRVMVGATEDLSESVGMGTFREDLYYLVNTVMLEVPSLRNRKEDIEQLATFFLNNKKPQDQHKSLSPGATKSLKVYHWPGNVRELQNVMERAFILSDGPIIEKDHLSESVFKVAPKGPQKEIPSLFQEMTLNELEKRHICQTLEFLGGNKTKTAKTLGITVKTLYNKLHSYGMIAGKDF